MNNEPVAYKAWHEDLGWTYHDWKDGFTSEGCIPLYTHPAKTVTDEEIREVINENVENVTVAEMVMFLTVCKAILRKAQNG